MEHGAYPWAWRRTRAVIRLLLSHLLFACLLLLYVGIRIRVCPSARSIPPVPARSSKVLDSILNSSISRRLGEETGDQVYYYLWIGHPFWIRQLHNMAAHQSVQETLRLIEDSSEYGSCILVQKLPELSQV